MKIMTKEEEEFINKILENIKSNPTSEKDISELKKSIFDANQKYADNTSDFEHQIYSNLIKSISKLSKETSEYQSIFTNKDPYEIEELSFTEYLPTSNGEGFIIYKYGSELKIYPVYPILTDNTKIDIKTYDFSNKSVIYSDYDSEYPHHETKESLIKKIENDTFMHTNYLSFDLRNSNGIITDRKTAYSSRAGDNPILTSNLFLKFLIALNDTESIKLIKDNQSEKVTPFYSFENMKHDIKDISISLNQISNIITDKKEIIFNDLDNGVNFISKKGKYTYFTISEQNAKFAILFKNKFDYVVYQLAYDLSFNDDCDAETVVSLNSSYLEGGIGYTNSNSYNYMISKEFIENSSIGEILEKECFLLKVSGDDIILNKNKGYLSNFGFDVVSAQSALTEEYGLSLESLNQYNGEPVIIFANAHIDYPENRPTMKSIRDQLFFTIGNGYSWNQKGYLESSEKKYNLNYEDSLKVNIPEGERNTIYPLCEYSMVISFPDNITNDWLDEVKLAIIDVFIAGTDDDIKFMIKSLEKRDIVKDFISEQEGLFKL